MQSSAIMIQREKFAPGAKRFDYCHEICFNFVSFEGDSVQHTSKIYIYFVRLIYFLNQLCKPPGQFFQ